MGETTNISWTNKTYNPWHGCTKVSPGCAHCYMFRDKKKYGQDGSIIVRSQPGTFNAPLKWKEPALVFTCSWSDFFHEVADDWRDEAWDIIRRTPHLTYQVLTKRPERILEHLPADWNDGYPNVWLGTSVENQLWAERRIPILRRVPAVVRFLSCEPLLGPVDLHMLICDYFAKDDPRYEHGIDWVIVGGESGPGFRYMRPEWARTIRDNCLNWEVPFFFKQSSGYHSETGKELDGQRWEQMPVVWAEHALAATGGGSRE